MGARRLVEKGVEVHMGLMAEESLEINLPYIHRSLTRTPFVLLKLALTLDGRLSLGAGRRITCDTSIERVHELRATMEAVAVGSGTIRSDDPELDRRLYRRVLPPPVRVVFDSSLAFPAGHRWLAKGDRVIIYSSGGAEEAKARDLEAAGAQIVRLPEGEGGLDLIAWRRDLAARGWRKIVV
jgi:diaminohydroxyphosphoribosylaminopyrimidine deaminase/5-amino-6-(5-phosphoribosylamino)uracil reductase